MQSLVTQYSRLTGRCWVTTFHTILLKQLLSNAVLLFCATSCRSLRLLAFKEKQAQSRHRVRFESNHYARITNTNMRIRCICNFIIALCIVHIVSVPGCQDNKAAHSIRSRVCDTSAQTVSTQSVQCVCLEDRLSGSTVFQVTEKLLKRWRLKAHETSLERFLRGKRSTGTTEVV